MNTSDTLHRSSICWRAILAGSLVAVSIHLLLTLLGTGITALIVKPSTSDTPVQSLTYGVAITWTLSALISLWVGGMVAGKVGARGDEEDGKLHGFIVWSLTTVIAFILVAAGIGKSLGVAGQVVGAAGKAAVEAIPNLAAQSAGVIKEYSSELRKDDKPLPAAATRDIALAMKNYLIVDDGRTTQNRQALVDALSRNTTATPEEAGRTVDEWTASFDRAANEAKQAADVVVAKAKEAADTASNVTGAAGIWTFIAFWVGAMIAAWGGKCGALGCSPAVRELRPVGRAIP